MCRDYTNNPTTSHPFAEFVLKAPRFNLIISRLTGNTYLLLCLPPGDMDMECARLNIMMARQRFVNMGVSRGAEAGRGRDRSMAEGEGDA